MVNMSDSDPKVYFGNSETVYLLNLKHHVVNEIENEDGFVLLPVWGDIGVIIYTSSFSINSKQTLPG